MNVTVCGRWGLAYAYGSVLSTAGSAAISGAARWLDATAVAGPSPYSEPASTTPTAPTARPRRRANRPRKPATVLGGVGLIYIPSAVFIDWLGAQPTWV